MKKIKIMEINKLESLLNLGDKLFSDYYTPKYNGNYTYTYEKDIFTEKQLEFLKQFEGKTLDMFLDTPTPLETYNKTLAVKDEGEGITIVDDFRRVLYHYLTFVLQEDLKAFLELVDTIEFNRRQDLDFNNEIDILYIFNVNAVMRYFNDNLENYQAIEKFLASRKYWMINGHHEIYKYKII